MSSVRLPLTLVVLSSAAVLGASCHGVPLVAPSGTAITMFATATVVPLNGSTEITAVLIEGARATNNTVTNGVGTAVHDGTVVTFSTTLGRVEPAEAKTTDGKATVKLLSDGRSGVATVRAFSGGASQTMEITVGAAAAVRVLVTATPQSLPFEGGTATIQARVEDQQGNGLSGVPVSFSTSAGSLSATSATSGDSGLATTTLATAAAATVTASAGGGTGTLSGTVAVTIRPRTGLGITPPASATVSVPTSFVITVNSSGAGTTAVVSNVVVQFSDGESVSLGTLSSSATTNLGHLFGSSGIHTVTASGKDSEGNPVSATTQVAVVALQANGTASPAQTAFGNSVLFTVTVTPATASIDHYLWDFGEGAPQPPTSSSARNYVFQSRGTKTVTVTVVPTKGPSITVLMQVEIQ